MAQIRSEVKILLEVTEKEFSLICHALTGSSRFTKDYIEAAKDLGANLMGQKRALWNDKLQAADHALEVLEGREVKT